eukprot:716870-Prorocentrum_minimum.AAC.1
MCWLARETEPRGGHGGPVPGAREAALAGAGEDPAGQLGEGVPLLAQVYRIRQAVPLHVAPQELLPAFPAGDRESIERISPFRRHPVWGVERVLAVIGTGGPVN